MSVRGHEEILHASIAVIKPIKHFHIAGFANNNTIIFNLFQNDIVVIYLQCCRSSNFRWARWRETPSLAAAAVASGAAEINTV